MIEIIVVGLMAVSGAQQPDAGKADSLAQAAVAALSKSVRDKNIGALDDAIKTVTLLKAQRAALAELQAALWHRDLDVRGLAAYAVVQIDPLQGREAVPVLSEALKGKETRVRSKAAFALGNLGTAASAALPALKEALEDPETTVRATVAESLWKISKETRLALPVLRAALKDREPRARMLAIFVLGHMGPDAGDAALDLGAVLTSDGLANVRAMAAGALGHLGSAAKGATRSLLQAMEKDEEPSVRGEAMDALIQCGLVDVEAAPALGGMLSEKDKDVRRSAIRALTGLGPAAQGAAGALMKIAAHDDEEENRVAALFALQQIRPDVGQVVPVFIERLADRAARVREMAAMALANLGPQSKGAGLALGKALRDDDGKVRSAAGLALGNLGAEARPAVATLIGMLRSADVEEQRRAARVLAVCTPAAKDAVAPLLECLADADREVRMEAVSALSGTGAQSQAPVKTLTEALESGRYTGKNLRPWAALCLARMGAAAQPAVPALIRVLEDEDASTRGAAAHALGKLGPAASAAVMPLIGVLHDEDAITREAASFALASIGPEALQPVASVLDDRDAHVRAAAMQALVNIVAFAQGDSEAAARVSEAAPLFSTALGNKDAHVRAGAAQALGIMGLPAKRAIPELREALKDEHGRVRLAAASALASIAMVLHLKQDTHWIGALEDTAKVLEGAKNAPGMPTREQTEWASATALVNQSIHGMKAVERGQLYDRILRSPWLPWGAGGAVYVVTFLSLWSMLLWLRPRTILRLNAVLGPMVDVQMPAWFGGFKFSLRDAFLLGPFKHHDRVLDAWVDEHVGAARENYPKNEAVRARGIHVAIPVVINDRVVPGPTARDFAGTFAKKRACLLIWGEGGSGKTSIACQLGQWAMADDRAERLSEQRMLPVVIDQDLVLPAPENGSVFAVLAEAIRGQLQALTGTAEPVALDLLDQLLRRQHIFVIVDHLSEMREATRGAIRPGHADFLVNALVVTSRTEERLDGVPRSVTQPVRIEGNRLASFMEGYLDACGRRQDFSDQEFFAACSRLALLMGKRTITALLAKLYVEFLISHKEGTPGAMPISVPDLMLGYLNELNRNIAQDQRVDDRQLHRCAASLAWKCVEQAHRPGAISLEEAHQALGDNPGDRLAYLENRLGIIRTAPQAHDRIMFTLDPLAEYLAALYLLDKHGENVALWSEFVQKAERLGETGASFLQVVRDCGAARGAKAALEALRDNPKGPAAQKAA